jgi:hypothetical protein
MFHPSHIQSTCQKLKYERQQKMLHFLGIRCISFQIEKDEFISDTQIQVALPPPCLHRGHLVEHGRWIPSTTRLRWCCHSRAHSWRDLLRHGGGRRRADKAAPDLRRRRRAEEAALASGGSLRAKRGKTMSRRLRAAGDELLSVEHESPTRRGGKKQRIRLHRVDRV